MIKQDYAKQELHNFRPSAPLSEEIEAYRFQRLHTIIDVMFCVGLLGIIIYFA